MMHPIFLIKFRRFPLLIILLSAILFSACTKNEFTLEFKLPESCNNTYTLIYYGSDRRGGVPVETAVAVSKGQAQLVGLTRNPTVVSIYYNHSELPLCIAYAERGDRIVFEGKEDNPVEWNVSGNKVNGNLSDFRRENRGLISDAAQAPEESLESSRKRLNGGVKKYIEAHKSDLASLIILMCYYDASVDPEGFLQLKLMLEREGVPEEGSTILETLMRQDLLTETRTSPLSQPGGTQKLQDLIVKSFDRNYDTVKLASGKRPILIYLWRRDDGEHQIHIDSLKRLARWRADSASMPMVDICLDSDSTSWTYALRSDSLRQVLHVWMPRGIAEPSLMQMGVGGSPWWIVVGSDGKLQASTSDMSSAIEKFKKWRK